MTAPPLNVCVRKLPLDEATLIAERDILVQRTLDTLRAAVANRDLDKAFRGFRMVQSCQDLEMRLTLTERAELVHLSVQIGLLEPPQSSWVSVSVAARALKTAGVLLGPRLPGLVPKIKITHTQIVQAYQTVHGRKQQDPPQCPLASHSTIRAHGEALFFLARNAKFYMPAGTAALVADLYLPAIAQGDSTSVTILEDQFLLAALYPGWGNDDPVPRVDAFMAAWSRIDSNAEWDAAWLLLLRRLSKYKLSSNAFGPHLPQIFNRIHGFLRVSAGAPERKTLFSAFQFLMPKRSQLLAGKLVVDLLGLETAMDRLEFLLASVRTHVHPSNSGQQAERIVTFITSMCDAFATTLGRNPNSLSLPIKRRFLQAVLPLLEPSLLGKSLMVVNMAQAAIRHLAWVAPITVCERLLPGLIESGLDPNNLTRSHQAPAAMKALTVLIQPMVLSGPHTRRVLREKLPVLLMQSLPGIDPNDQRKTAVTMMLSYLVLSCIPIVSSEDDVAKYAKSRLDYGVDVIPDAERGGAMVAVMAEDDDGEDSAVPDLSAWASALVGRLLVLAQSRGKRAKKGMSAQLDGLMDFFYEATCRLAFQQMSPRVLEAGPLRDVTNFVLDECLPNAHIEALALCRALANNSPHCLRSLVPPLAKLVDRDQHKDRATWALVCLGGLARLSGAFLLNVLDDLDGAISRGLQHEDLVVRKMSAKLIRRVARCMLDTYQVKPDEPIVRFGVEAVWAEAKPKWHVCSPAEEKAAQAFVLGHWRRALQGAKEDKDKRQTHLLVAFQCVRGMLTHIQAPCGLSSPLMRHSNDWPTHTALFAEVQAVAQLLQQDTRGLKVCCKMLGLLGQGARGPRGCGRGEHVKGFSLWSSWLGDLSNSRARAAEERAKAIERFRRGESATGEVEDSRDQVEMAHVVLSHIEHRLHVRTFEAGFWAAREAKDQGGEAEAFYQRAGDVLWTASLHGFSDVRKMAQTQLKYVHLRAGYVAQAHLPRTLALLSKAAPVSEEWTGAIYLLGSEKMLSLMSRKWSRWAEAVHALVLRAPATVQALPAHRQAKAQDRLQRVVQRVLADWQRFPAEPGVPVQEREGLLRDLIGTDQSAHWRLKLAGLTAVGILVDGPAPREAWAWCVACVQSDILPLATLAMAIMRRLFAFGSAPADLLTSKDLWRCMGKVLAEDRNLSGNNDEEKAEWSSGVGELLKVAKSLSCRPDFPHSRIDMFSAKEFHSTKAALWTSLTRTCGDKTLALDTLKFLASADAESAKDRLLRRTACAELFAGLVRAKPEWAEEALPTVTRLLNELPNGGLWGDAFRFASYGESKAGPGLARYCETELSRVLSGIGADGEPMADNEGYMFTSNLLRVCVGTLLEYRLLSGKILPKVLSCFTHQYKAVREMAGVVTAMSIVIGAITDKQQIVQSALTARATSPGGLEACFHLLLPLCHQGDAVVYMDVLIPLLVPVVIGAQGHADVDLAQLAKQSLQFISGVVRCSALPAQALTFEKTLAEEAAVAKDWSKRRAVASLLGPFHYNHSNLLFRQGAGALVQKTAELLLKDSQAEVREQAKSLLSGLFAAAVPLESVFVPARDRYIKMARTSGDANKATRRTGVLALAALVLAFPYEVPLFLPPAVVELARAVSSSNDPAARQALSEFRRTHQDDWAEHKLKFDSDELGELDDTLVSPDYYA